MASAQEVMLPKTITIHVVEQPLEDVLQTLHQKYSIHFYYSSSKIDLKQMVTLHADELAPDAVMKKICDQTGIIYKINENQIVLGKKEGGAVACNFYGYVSDSLTGERLIGAAVFVQGSPGGTSSNAYGYYSFTVPPGSYNILCTYMGYKRVTKKIELHEHQEVSFLLAPEFQEINAVTLESEKFNRAINQEIGTDIAPASLMKSYPALFSENDVIQFLKMMPGVQTTTEGLNGLFVRGGMPQHTSFIIDDAPMYNMFHFSGWFSTINPDAVKEVRLYKSHLPARSGGSLSSVAEIRLRDGNNQHFNASGSIGSITSRLTLEGPVVKNKSSFIISARRTYLDQLIKLFQMQKSLEMDHIYFYDLNAKLNFTLNHENRIYFSSYIGKDMIQETGGVNWGNSFVSGRWNHLFSDRIFSNLCIAGSWYKHSFEGYTGSETFQLAIRIRNYNLKYDVTVYTTNNSKISVGLNLRTSILPPTTISKTDAFSEWQNQERGNYIQTTYGAYLQGELKLLPKISADLGVRLNITSKEKPHNIKTQIHPEPTVSLEYRPSEKLAVKSAYSRNYQYYHGISVFEMILPFDKFMMISKALKPQYADHFSAGIYFVAEKHSLEISAEPYYSFYRNQYRMPVSNDVFFNRESEINPHIGTLKSYGLEISARKLSGRFTGLLSYTLSRSMRQEDGINQDRYYEVYHDRRHDLVISLNYQIAPKTAVSANWVYMSGNPYALPVGKYEIRGRSIPLYDDSNLYNKRMPDYHRMDISIRLGLGRKLPVRHFLTFMVYNVYAHKNPIFYTYGDVADGSLDNDPNRGYSKRSFSMMEYYFFNIFPSLSYEFKFGK